MRRGQLVEEEEDEEEEEVEERENGVVGEKDGEKMQLGLSCQEQGIPPSLLPPFHRRSSAGFGIRSDY